MTPSNQPSKRDDRNSPASHRVGAQILLDRTIVITGGARGIGRTLAEYCVNAGARVVVGDILETPGEEAVQSLRSIGGDARFVRVDLANPDSIANFANDVREHERIVHGLVNNGAVATGVGGLSFQEIDRDLWDRVMNVNVRGVWLATRAFAPLLSASLSGRIVNIASDTALWGAPRLLAYVASKGAVIAMTRSLARELGPMGIGITALAPGILRTESTEYVPEERHRLYEAMRAVPGAQQPEDIAPTIAFLLTPESLALTGQVIPANAGFVFT